MAASPLVAEYALAVGAAASKAGKEAQLLVSSEGTASKGEALAGAEVAGGMEAEGAGVAGVPKRAAAA